MLHEPGVGVNDLSAALLSAAPAFRECLWPITNSPNRITESTDIGCFFEAKIGSGRVRERDSSGRFLGRKIPLIGGRDLAILNGLVSNAAERFTLYNVCGVIAAWRKTWRLRDHKYVS